MAPLLLALFAIRCVDVFAAKYSSASLKAFGTRGILAGCFISSAVACVVFLVMSGFKPVIDLRITVYALVYALVCISSVALSFVIYRYFPVTACALIGSSASLLSALLIGWAFFSEVPDLWSILRLALMLGATVLIFFDSRKKTAFSPEKTSFSWIRILLILAFVAVSCTAMPITRCYAGDPNVPGSSASWFLMTNVFMLVFLVPLSLVLFPKTKSENAVSLRRLPFKCVLSVAMHTLCSNGTSVLQVVLVSMITLSAFGSLSSAFGILSATAVSLLWKEKPRLKTWIAVALSLVAVFLP